MAARKKLKPRTLAPPIDCVYPAHVTKARNQHRITTWRQEQAGKLPARDVILNGVGVGWKPKTIAPFLLLASAA